MIIGRQDKDKVVELSIEDIEYCKENGFRYLQPSVMYFMDNEVEKKEVDLLKHMLKSINKQENTNEGDSDDDLDDDNIEEVDSEEEN